MKKHLFIFLISLLFVSACQKEKVEVDATGEQEVASADWTEAQVAAVNDRVNSLDAKTKQLEQEVAKLQLAAQAQQPFKDVPFDYWAYVEIMDLYKKGVIKGYEVEKMFYPERSITRYQAASMLVKVFQLPLSSSPSQFSDVPTNSPIAREIMTAYEAGFFTGSNGRFMPNEPMKRKHMAMVLQRAFQLQKKADVPYAGYKDVNAQTSGAEAIQIISQYGIAQGSNGYFYPDQSTKRSQFSAFVYRALALQK
jgi:hypothetical protein